MKVISSAFLGSLFLFTSCGKWGKGKDRISNEPVLKPLVQAETQSRIEFARHVKPILEKRCVWCHDGSDAGVPYSLANREGAFENKRIVPRKPEQSLFYVAAGGKHPDLEGMVEGSMEGSLLASSDLKVLRRWILSGAIWPTGEAGQLERE